MRKSILKRTLSIVLACVMLMSIFVAIPMQAGATDRKSIDRLTLTCDTSKVYYNQGKAPTWNYKIKDGKTTLVEGKDYTLSYSRKSVGHCVATFKGKGYYQGSRKVDFVILPTPISKCEFSSLHARTYPLTVTEKTLNEKIYIRQKDGKKVYLNRNIDYRISIAHKVNYKGYKDVCVTVKGIGNYTGTQTISLTIR